MLFQPFPSEDNSVGAERRDEERGVGLYSSVDRQVQVTVMSDRSPGLTVIAVNSYDRGKLINAGFEKRREFRQKGVLDKRIPVGSGVHESSYLVSETVP